MTAARREPDINMLDHGLIAGKANELSSEIGSYTPSQ
jgi:hypothetical protein